MKSIKLSLIALVLVACALPMTAEARGKKRHAAPEIVLGETVAYVYESGMIKQLDLVTLAENLSAAVENVISIEVVGDIPVVTTFAEEGVTVTSYSATDLSATGSYLLIEKSVKKGKGPKGKKDKDDEDDSSKEDSKDDDSKEDAA